MSALVLLLTPQPAYVSYWAAGSGSGEGACGRLVSERTGDGGMLNQGYGTLPDVTAVREGGGWRIPVTTTT